VFVNVLDLFSGCGGISSGFAQAGYQIKAGIDFDKDSIDTFSENFKDALAICADLNSYSENDIFNQFEQLDIQVVVGGPPCQGFSNANRWDKEKKDPRNKLFYEYLKFVKVLKPKIVLIENVRGMLTKDNGYAKDRIINLVQELGYNVSSNVLNAAEYGVPQNRYRAFFIAIREDLPFDENIFENLRTKEKVNVKDAIGELYNLEKADTDVHSLTSEPDSPYRKYLRSRKKIISNHEIVYPAEATQTKIKFVPQGGNWRDIPKELFDNQRNNRHSSAYKRLDEKSQSVTIDTGNAHSNYYHPKYNRIPTVREAARIQSFQDKFIFSGSRTSQYRQIGNAVPPLLAKSIADELKVILNKK
jgi:DNA (cytosine-5)-methyltransferase 1